MLLFLPQSEGLGTTPLAFRRWKSLARLREITTRPGRVRQGCRPRRREIHQLDNACVVAACDRELRMADQHLAAQMRGAPASVFSQHDNRVQTASRRHSAGETE